MYRLKSFTGGIARPSLLKNISTSSCAIPRKFTQHPASAAFRGRLRSGGRRSAAVHPLRVVPTAVVARALRLQPETYVSRVAAIMLLLILSCACYTSFGVLIVYFVNLLKVNYISKRI